MMNEKATKRQMFEALINFANGGAMEYTDEKTDSIMEITDEALRAFAEHEIELLDKKAVKAKESAAKRKKEDSLLTDVSDALTDEYQTIAEITEELNAAGIETTVSKVTYRLGVLVKEGIAEKADVKIEATEESKARTVKAYKRA